MIIKDFMSHCEPELNTKILRSIENLVCRYREILPNGWRCCIRFQRKALDGLYYLLDVQSNEGGGELAPIKMQTLELFPNASATGNIPLEAIRDILSRTNATNINFRESLGKKNYISELSSRDWDTLKSVGITHWYGGIRVPYDILVTDYTVAERFKEDERKQRIDETRGEIRITFSGATEWQDTFFCFSIFDRIQGILNSLWSKDQIWYNLRGFKDDPKLQFWVEAMDIAEAPET